MGEEGVKCEEDISRGGWSDLAQSRARGRGWSCLGAEDLFSFFFFFLTSWPKMLELEYGAAL